MSVRAIAWRVVKVLWSAISVLLAGLLTAMFGVHQDWPVAVFAGLVTLMSMCNLHRDICGPDRTVTRPRGLFK